MTVHKCAMLCAALGMLLAGTGQAAGDLDPDFGAGGVVLLPIGTGDAPNDQLLDVIVDSQQRIVGAGFQTDGPIEDGDRDMAVVRLLGDGSPDPAFGSGGMVRLAFDLGGFEDSATSVVETDDGRYVVCGRAETDPSTGGFGALAVARLQSDGTLDTSLDFDGRRSFTIQFAPGDGLNSGGHCALTADGRIVLAGSVVDAALTRVSTVVVRLLPDGSFDTSFNGSGWRIFDPAEGTPQLGLARDVALQSDGGIVVTGAANVDTTGALNYDMFVARLTAAGALDSSFGNAGVRLVGLDQGGAAGNADVPSALALRPDGRMVVAGTAQTASSGTDVLLVQLLADGSLDPDFGTTGRALVGYDGGGSLDDGGADIALDPAGRILVAGRVSVAADNEDLAVLRLGAGGAADASFGSGGWTTFGIDGTAVFDSEFAQAIALDAQQRVLAAGAAYLSSAADRDMLIVRLTSEHLFADGFEAIP